MHHVSNISNLFSGLYKRRSTVRRVSKASSDAGPELAGRESHCGDGKPEGPDCPLEKGVRGIETGHQMPGRSWRARKAIVAMESPKAQMCPLETGVWWGINKSSSDDRPGPCICESKYVEDAKAARSVRVWDRVPIKNMG